MDSSQHLVVASFLASSLADAAPDLLASRQEDLARLVQASQGADPFTKTPALFHRAGLDPERDPELTRAMHALGVVGALDALPQCQKLFLDAAAARMPAPAEPAPDLGSRLVERRKRPRDACIFPELAKPRSPV